MPAPRKRTDARGRALPCVVRIPPPLAEVLYRERIKGRYRDETELVVSIIREWAAKLEAVDPNGRFSLGFSGISSVFALRVLRTSRVFSQRNSGLKKLNP